MKFTKKTFSTYDELVSFLSKNNDLKYIYRGYCNDNQLKAKLFRENNIDNEFDYLIEFEKYAPLFTNLNNPTSLYVLAQHYGLPTRLIDFTYNPYIAIYFALNYFEKKESFRIIMIDKTCLKDFCFSSTNCMVKDSTLCFNRINEFNLTSVIRKKIECQEEVDKELPMLFTANYTNNRIYLQQGLFLITFSENNLTNIANSDVINGFILNLKFTEEERKKALDYLDLLGINNFRLMYDLDSLSKFIKNKIQSNHNCKENKNNEK